MSCGSVISCEVSGNLASRHVSPELLASMEQSLATNVHEMGLQNSWPRKGKGTDPHRTSSNLKMLRF